MEEGGQKVHISSYKINKYWDTMFNMINAINTTVCYIKIAKKVNPKNSPHKEQYFYLILYLYEMIDVH